MVACTPDEERVLVESELTYDLVGLKSLEVNDMLYRTFCSANKHDGMWNTLGAARVYSDKDGNEYTSFAIGGCYVLYENTLYHGFDLLEDGSLTVEELEMLEFPFSVKED